MHMSMKKLCDTVGSTHSDWSYSLIYNNTKPETISEDFVLLDVNNQQKKLLPEWIFLRFSPAKSVLLY